MPRINYTDPQLLAFSEEHLLYELNILRWLVDAIPKTPPSSQLSANLESFAIHLRGLIDFLYDEPKNADPDDVIAADFFDTPGAWKPGAMSATLGAARVRANKEVSHITFRRKAGMAPDKPWPVAALFNESPVYNSYADTSFGVMTKKTRPTVWAAKN